MNLKELAEEVGKIAQREVEKSFPGWVYYNANKMTYAEWDEMLEMAGEGNYQVLIMSQGPDWKRGQLVFKPEAMEKLNAARRQKMN